VTERDEFPAELLDALEADEPSAGFAERVMAARAAEVAAPVAGPRRWPWAAAAAAAVAALVLWIPLPTSGVSAPEARASVEVGARGVAVVEGGAEIAWAQSLGGAVVVDQAKGSVFYRVARGGPFVVRTPAGDVSVTGTSFKVEVPMKGMKMSAASGIAGAVLATAAWVTVYEGSVEVESKGEKVAVVAGERAELQAGAAPRRIGEETRAELVSSRDALRAQVDTLEGQLKEIMIARSSGEDPLAARNRQLEAEVRELRSSLDVEQQLRAQNEGEKVPFPEGLGDEYREAALKKGFEAAIAASGLQGEVKAIDCNEYPCIVFGEFSVSGVSGEETGDMADRFWDALEEQYPEEANNRGISHSKFRERSADGTVNQRSMFGVTVTPKDIDKMDEERRKKVNRRVRWRNQQYMDAVK
jgi:ferric-dicitrate binding protein FerR (iron transport regulator)